jgi:hypothetical protein
MPGTFYQPLGTSYDPMSLPHHQIDFLHTRLPDPISGYTKLPKDGKWYEQPIKRTGSFSGISLTKKTKKNLFDRVVLDEPSELKPIFSGYKIPETIPQFIHDMHQKRITENALAIISGKDEEVELKLYPHRFDLKISKPTEPLELAAPFKFQREIPKPKTYTLYGIIYPCLGDDS